jgi:uncharacterized sulfatase
MSRSIFLVLVLLGLSTTISHGQDNPNILFILVDDLGWSDLGCYDNTIIQTPNTDNLASKGMRFTDAYAASVCAPTRAALQTGQYPARLQMTGIPNPHRRPFAQLSPPEVRWQLPLRFETIGETLQKAGYVSGIFGKWHLGYEPTHQPVQQGYVYPDQSGLESEFGKSAKLWCEQNNQKGIGQQVLQSLRFIEQNQDQPWFCTVSYNMVHTALDSRPDLIDKYKKIVAKNRTIINPVYAAMCEQVDESVGLLLQGLEAFDQAENTVVIFMSDNGGVIEERGFLFHGYEELVTSNWPLKSEKGSLYEGGIRVPMIIHWPGVTTENSTSDQMVHAVDLYPTLLEITGAPAPSHMLDGMSWVPILQGQEIDRNVLYWHYPHYHHSRPASAIKAGDSKLIYFYESKDVELYDLSTDIGEQYDLAGENPARALALKTKLFQWLDKVGAAMPDENPNYDYSKELLWGERMDWKVIRGSGIEYGVPEGQE